MENGLRRDRKLVFVTGGSSGLLQEAVRLIDRTKFDVVCLTRRLCETKEPSVHWLIGDLHRPETYSAALSEADIIIHGAALTHSTDPSAYFRTNVEGTKILLDAVPKGRNPHFVLISSRTATPESGAYGESKWQAEELVKNTADKWLILRPAEIFGGAKREGVDRTIDSAVKGGLVACPVGMKSKLYPIHQTDAAKVIYRAIFEEERLRETQYINGNEGYSYVELLRLVAAVTGRRIFALPTPKPALKLAAFLGRITGFDVGFVPDQIERLYSLKQHGAAPEIAHPLKEYIKQRASEKATSPL